MATREARNACADVRVGCVAVIDVCPWFAPRAVSCVVVQTAAHFGRHAEVSDQDIEQNQGGGAGAGDQAQALLDEVADRLAIAAQQPGEEEKRRAARDDRREDEQRRC